MAIASIGGSTVPLNPNPTPGPAPGTQSSRGTDNSAPTGSPVAGPTPAPPPGGNATAASLFLQVYGVGAAGLGGTLIGNAIGGPLTGFALGSITGYIGKDIGGATPQTGLQYNLWDGQQYVPILFQGSIGGLDLSTANPNALNVSIQNQDGVDTITVVVN